MPLMQMFTLILTLALQSTTFGFTPEQLWQDWPEERFVQTPAPCLRPADLTDELQRLADLHPDAIELEEIGRSVGGRDIHMLRLGHGPRTILLWSQMHGDEPSATPALLDIATFLLSRTDEPEVEAILDDLTLLMIPMLNPDGAEILRTQESAGHRHQSGRPAAHDAGRPDPQGHPRRVRTDTRIQPARPGSADGGGGDRSAGDQFVVGGVG